MASGMSAEQIEQMNKVRVSLGLQPLEVPGQGPQFKEDDDGSDSDQSEDLSTLEKRAAAAGNNWQRHEAERKEKEERQKRKDAAKKARDLAARNEKLQGKGLGDEDAAEEVDTRTWLLQQKKRQKKIDKARKLEEELAAREQQAEYTAKDLAGVKVGHEAAEFDELTGEQILTLKDAAIGEESEDDELENTDLKAKEKLEEKLKLLKKRPDYDPTEQGEQKNLLSKYDEEIDGKKQKRFTLDGQGTAAEALKRKAANEGEVKGKGVKISLDILKDDAPTSDYVDPSTIKVKKAKKSKKEKKTRQKAADEDDIVPLVTQSASVSNGDAMDLDNEQEVVTASKKRSFEFDDDEDLQAKLAEQRRQALKKRKKTDAAELARQMREEMPVDEPEPEEEGLVMDETTEFVANLKKPDEADEDDIRAKRSKSAQPGAAGSPDVQDEDDDGDTNMGQQSYADAEEEEERQVRIKREASNAAEISATGLEDEESLVGSGIGASLNMLRKRGLIDSPAAEGSVERERQRMKFLADKQQLVEEYDQRAKDQREADRRSGRFDKMTNRERDALARQQNEQREQYISRLLAEKFNKEYKPDVKLRYNDEHGREMNQKEAFKHLSHMFHGKGSGKGKTEKRLKKIEDEKKSAARGMLNVGEEGGFSNVQGREGKRQKTAGVRLQ
ncbi:U4/U6.U5 tri-snRNP-associated protein snu66 [Fulvia fulva]|uniref:U4/U6.U5 tri-snRNP-associated protein snu66 n=1 Tax=Passalora fulva TaxID=5499 RepID=A0A9Q8L773_PASFU|nr:U4/U6.U5 tri-snRNP-associated protein snu66 [Fulvia fulva]KAK4636147.1 U4/U6.U5 tri-snRNP-associated protein snu66 [Fulvia fulva]KAK4637318.1 U4/U6.U5 tri-snRNP-associated protein snu66 [Fulvia fulva]UJO12041.1 U4/U6.U5 tri-snRNP-associated protein snu66 [Fulvia fulva]WPV08182.1 U4/U6.U5 tri-snRNP-associated protein snu66 [Fulvia fulva]WPV25163.1 U4/U6.U5 tri-snRNP-associated protein snu66 [Fulvia fulva]